MGATTTSVTHPSKSTKKKEGFLPMRRATKKTRPPRISHSSPKLTSKTIQRPMVATMFAATKTKIGASVARGSDATTWTLEMNVLTRKKSIDPLAHFHLH